MTTKQGSRPISNEPPPEPLAAFKRPEELVLKDLVHFETRKYLADSGFLDGLKTLREGTQDEIRALMCNDPRIMQAVGFLTGTNVGVTEQDVRAAERVGDIKKRDVVQFENLQIAHKHTNAADAKAAGNEHFKVGKYATALACYQRALFLIGSALDSDAANAPPATPGPSDDGDSGEDDEAMSWDNLQAKAKAKESLVEEDKRTFATLLSNSAMAQLKLAAEDLASMKPEKAIERHRDALANCERALNGAPQGFDVSKVYYRRALALEGLEQLEEACTSMEIGRKACKAAGDGEAATRMQREVKRLQRAKLAADDEADAKRQQAEREAKAGAAREAGRALEPSLPKKTSGGSGGSGAVSPVDVTDTALVSAPATSRTNPFAHVQEQDFTFWSQKYLSARLKGLRHERAGTTIVVGGFDERRSEIHASIKSKRGKGKSLFYDLDLMLTWVGHSAIGRGSEGAGKIVGEFRLYNVGQDTKFEVGGDMHTSYLYSLGFEAKYHNDDNCELWAQQIKFEAAELFEIVSGEVGKWVEELVAKATGKPPKDVLV